MATERRRRRGDGLMRFIQSMNLLCWLLLLGALMLFHYARPEVEYGLLRHMDVTVRDHWLAGSKAWLYSLLIVCSVLSVVVFVLRKQRSRRASDARGYNLLTIVTFCIALLLTISL